MEKVKGHMEAKGVKDKGKRLKLKCRVLQAIVLIGWMVEMMIAAKVGRAAFQWLPWAMLPLTALAALGVKIFSALPKQEQEGVRIFSASVLTSHPALLLLMMICVNLAAFYFSCKG